MKSIDFNNGDINILSKRLQMVTDTAQKLQKTKGSILLVLGELFYNVDLGLDYTKVLDMSGKNTSDEHKKLAIIEGIMKDTNVQKVTNISIETDRISRKQTISLELKYKDENRLTTIGGITIG